jgi:hypothetical protein
MAIITLNNNSLSSVTALPNGIVTAGALASGVGGKVLQVVSATDSTTRGTTSGTFVTASNTMSVNITPSSASNKIFIVTSGTCYTNTSNQRWRATIYRDSTNLDGGGSTGQGLCQGYAGSTNLITSLNMSILDSPNTTSQITYQVYIRRNDSGEIVLNEYQVKGSITAYEIAG